ncbi:hypothetical protein SEA_LILMAC1015_55 [Arthrobacter phage Lilmac1015]|uniref:Uncharacterized protein n=1 Tax=Arthrobacter phage Lilmac1015 TaxID=2912653 RepID=A0AA49BPM8_9CAUD|nr:hypothetical protein SEA_LILMAC1015_55 [Arthrobacter phage Lilmac1015]
MPLNFAQIRIAGQTLLALTATSEETGIRYLVRSEYTPDVWKLHITEEDEDSVPLTFDSEGEAVDYADRFDFNQGLTDRWTLPTILEVKDRVSGTTSTPYETREEAAVAAGQVLLASYRGWMIETRAKWWSRRAVRLLRQYGRVETPDVVVTLVDPQLEEAGQ